MATFRLFHVGMHFLTPAEGFLKERVASRLSRFSKETLDAHLYLNIHANLSFLIDNEQHGVNF